MLNPTSQPTLTNPTSLTSLTGLAQPTLTNLTQPGPNLAFSSPSDIFQELASHSSFSTADPPNPLLPSVSNSLLPGQGSLPPPSSLLQPPPFLLQADPSMWEGNSGLLEPFHSESKLVDTAYEGHSAFDIAGGQEEETMELVDTKVTTTMSSLTM